MKLLPQSCQPEGYRFRDIQLEMSLKPFWDNSPETREAVCREVFEQWRALTRHAESISIMLWIGDGSEILEYAGNPDHVFEWGRYQGSANPHRWNSAKLSDEQEKDEGATGVHAWDPKHDPDGIGLHRRSYLYRENPAEFSFHWLRGLVSDLKRIGHEMTGKKIFVGETFDIGPEFSVSRFKYLWHPEILAGGNSLFKGEFISCEAVLHGDTRDYAGFPGGIPNGTRFGHFLGRQAKRFFEDIGFDFLWLSNGFGFALEPWGLVGNLFDGLHFDPSAAAPTRERILRFWHDLREEFPVKYPIRTRGTNLCTGIDLGSDASPLRDIYHPSLNTEAPVNSPWAALDGDFGLELSGWMSHIARHPGETFRFRYYIHDPWWKNSPYLDRYERNPHDIFLPLSVSRIGKDGSVGIPRDLALLTIDDSDGCMPLSVPNEVTAHILRAREFAPDAAGPIVWAYPFDAAHDWVEKSGRPEIPFHADTFIGTVINDAVPLNTVIDAGDVTSALSAKTGVATGRVFLSPVPQPASDEESALFGIVDAGGTVLFYGPVQEGSVLMDWLGLSLEEPLEGDFALSLHHVPDREEMDRIGHTVRHSSFLSAGGFAEAPASQVPESASHLATASLAGHVRVAAAIATRPSGGRIGWVRGSLATAEFDPGKPAPIRGPILRPMDPSRFFPCGRLCRFVLDAFGWHAAVRFRGSLSRSPYYTIHRHRNAFVYSGYHLDENAILALRHPLGAPLLTSKRIVIKDGATEIHGSRAWSNEVRVFLQSGRDGIHAVRFEPVVAFGVYRRMIVSGCRDATLNFLLDPQGKAPLRILRNPVFPNFVGDHVDPVITETPFGPIVRVDHCHGDILFEW